jgi:hypothetical protein
LLNPFLVKKLPSCFGAGAAFLFEVLLGKGGGKRGKDENELIEG